MTLENNNVEATLTDSRIHRILRDLIWLCRKHKVMIDSANIHFLDWETFSEVEADYTEASAYWARIMSHITERM